MASPSSTSYSGLVAEAFRVYCDDASDELIAERWLVGDEGLGAPIIERLPSLSQASPALKPLLEWERQDWMVTRGTQVLCTVEFSRHGYTGDNGFQRFARLWFGRVWRCGSADLPLRDREGCNDQHARSSQA